MARLAPASPTFPIVLSFDEPSDETPGMWMSPQRVFILLLVSSMILATIIGNAMVCVAVMMVRKLKAQPANFLLVSLAVADFFVGLIVMPLALVALLYEDWPIGMAWCQLYTTADLALCTASIVNLCVISVDRYLVISRPLRYSAKRTWKLITVYIVVVWTIALMVSLSSHLVAQLLHAHIDDRTCQVIQNLGYQIYATTISFYGPTLIMVILYVKIWRAARKAAEQEKLQTGRATIAVSKPSSTDYKSSFDEGNGGTPSPTCNGKKKKSSEGLLLHRPSAFLHRPSALFQAVRPLLSSRAHERGEGKARRTLGVIMSVYIICWLPFFCIALLKSAQVVNVPVWLDVVALWLGYSNSMLNPLIYCKYNRDFRIPFREMLFCRCRTIHAVMRQESFTSRFGPPQERRLTIRPSMDSSNV